MQKIFF
jgi:hypothetical protein